MKYLKATGLCYLILTFYDTTLVVIKHKIPIVNFTTSNLML